MNSITENWYSLNQKIKMEIVFGKLLKECGNVVS
jgi:hypothetical protein